MLSKHLRLPSKTTIVKLSNKLANRPGLTESAMNIISSRVKNMNDKKLCMISFNEMSLKSHLDYITNKDVLKLVTVKGLKKNCTLVCDIGSNFQELNLDYENLSFLHNGKKILFLFDALHIMKAIRNNLMTYNFHFDDGKFASWKDIQQLNQIDSKNDIRCCPKLTQVYFQTIFKT